LFSWFRRYGRASASKNKIKKCEEEFADSLYTLFMVMHALGCFSWFRHLIPLLRYFSVIVVRGFLSNESLNGYACGSIVTGRVSLAVHVEKYYSSSRVGMWGYAFNFPT
jgi:hypothetical protein